MRTMVEGWPGSDPGGSRETLCFLRLVTPPPPFRRSPSPSLRDGEAKLGPGGG
jgi:hypothetical protein